MTAKEFVLKFRQALAGNPVTKHTKPAKAITVEDPAHTLVVITSKDYLTPGQCHAIEATWKDTVAGTPWESARLLVLEKDLSLSIEQDDA